MPVETVTITGLKELDRALGKFPDKLAEKLYKRAGRKAAQLLVREAKRRAPKVTGELRGNIAASVKVRSRGVKGATLEARIGMRSSKQHRGFVGRMLEKGTKDISPRPFLEPAFEASQGRMVQVFTTEGLRQVDRAAREARGGV